MDNLIKFFSAVFLAAVLLAPTIANAALVGRLAATEGGTDYQAYYDEDADLTWLADAGIISGNWSDANAWATNLNIAGITGWRLPMPKHPDSGCTYQRDLLGSDEIIDTSWGWNCTSGEMGHLFYIELGGAAGSPIAVTHNTNYDLFSNIQSDTYSYYWTGAEYLPNPDGNTAWGFGTGRDGGYLGNDSKDANYYAWAVYSGDVSAVPLPAAVWLFLTGLIGLIGCSKIKKRHSIHS